MSVRPADPDDALDVRRVLEGALLDVPADLEDRIRASDVFVAEADGVDVAGEADDIDDSDETANDGGPVVGALVLDGNHVEAVAVRRRRRGTGIGGELVRVAAERTDGSLTADFREEIRPFYESLGFDVGPAEASGEREGNRLRGRLDERPD